MAKEIHPACSQHHLAPCTAASTTHAPSVPAVADFVKKITPFPYLGEGQAVLVLVFILYFKVVKCFALRWSLREGLDALDVAGGEEAVVAIELPVVPVLIHLPPQDDDVPFVKLEVAGLFPLIRIESFAVGKLRSTLEKNKIHDSFKKTPARDGFLFKVTRSQTQPDCNQTTLMAAAHCYTAPDPRSYRKTRMCVVAGWRR